MKKVRRVGMLILVSIALTSLISCCGGGGGGDSAATTPTLPEGYNWHNNDEFGYKIGYPESWTVVSQETMELGPGIEHAQMFEDPEHPAVFTVMVNSEYDIQGLQAMGARDVVINGREGYEAIIQPMQGSKMKIVAFVVGDRYYLISCFTLADLWGEYVATFDNAINSFVVE